MQPILKYLVKNVMFFKLFIHYILLNIPTRFVKIGPKSIVSIARLCIIYITHDIFNTHYHEFIYTIR
jgi:hypothetical protein